MIFYSLPKIFSNELGKEPIRRVELSRFTCCQRITTLNEATENRAEHLETWHRESLAAEIGAFLQFNILQINSFIISSEGVLEDVSNVYLGGRLCAGRQPKIVVEPQD